MITILSLLVICIFSYYLIVCEYYDDGIIGRIALAVMSFSAGLGFAQVMADKINFDPVSQAMFAAVAVFEGRHIYRIFKAHTRSKNIIETTRRLMQ